MLQKVIANYLKCSLGLLEPIDPISVKSSLSVVEILNDGLARSNVAFSVAQKTCSTQFPTTNFLWQCVNQYIDTFALQNSCGLSTETFLELSTMQLSSTAVKYGDAFFVRKRGICIGSCIVPAVTCLFSKVWLNAPRSPWRYTGDQNF